MCHITCSCSPGKLTPVFVLKLCSWRKALVWSENYVLLVCCLGDFPVISEKLNVLETQMRSLQTARKNQLAGQGCGKQKLHTRTETQSQQSKNTHFSRGKLCSGEDNTVFKRWRDNHKVALS